ncbi:hypothetical protein QAO71_16980 (plasmid) [Halopseudomonas sp. SMJS2]|uniref:hypothetical protein n=1 Tax=Halopseudomonas sp. SMJS2 TaxID=3041098 RepID=UPI0024528713|nr:hypothetical protein [Halopseudomonas sp. SMJS2]WGK63465.1 hypothetical protein QAO71_16980 [Halopseudomonas sp. SMJS2]
MIRIKSGGIMNARKLAATALLERFDFGQREITDSDTGWRDMFLDHWERVLYAESADGQHRLVMHIHFANESSLVLDHYCLDLATGNMLVA